MEIRNHDSSHYQIGFCFTGFCSSAERLRHGAEHRFGLGFYSPTRIHVDTAGFRTWGRDYTRRTSLCRAIR